MEGSSGSPCEEVSGRPAHHSSHNAGDAHAPGGAILADVIYGSMSLGRRRSERKTAQQGLPLDVQIKGFGGIIFFFFFSHVFRLLSFRIGSEINMCKSPMISRKQRQSREEGRVGTANVSKHFLCLFF